MNEKMKKALEAAAEDIAKMSADDFFISLYGYTPAQEKAYTEEQFLVELDHLRTFFENGSYTFHPPFEGEVVPELSKLFWNHISKVARSDYEDTTATFPTYYVELPQFGIRVTHVYGQGTLTTVEEFDYSTPEYMVRNASRLKREYAWKKQEELKKFLKDKPNYLDEVKFSTTIDGTVVEDTGVIERVYTKNGILRYLIDSVNHGKVIVFYQNENHVNDVIEITVLHPDNYDSY
ncbi:hypothetical protein XbC2_403 [Xanthomonas phage XbC2]|nr:hypothetical protein XbC2_403 [Xanthomonas phage XbC2]